MKKFLALFMACAFAFAASAATTYQTLVFSRKQFQPSQFENPPAAQRLILTVPLIYKGTVSWKAELQKQVLDATTNSDCLLTRKDSKTIYLTMCQPCIDCYPCDTIALDTLEGGVSRSNPEDMLLWGTAAQTSTANAVGERVTKMNLYFIDTHKTGPYSEVEIFKVNMENELADFYTGSNKSGSMIDSNLGWFQGKRNNYTFKYQEALAEKLAAGGYKWGDAAAGKSTAYIKSISSMTGVVEMWLANVQDDADFYPWVKLTTTYKLSRNSSLTNTAVKETFSGTVTSTGSNGWEDCSVSSPAKFCEQYFYSNEWTTVNDKFDKYLAEKVYKPYFDGSNDHKFHQVHDGVDADGDPTNHIYGDKVAELRVADVLEDLLF